MALPGQLLRTTGAQFDGGGGARRHGADRAERNAVFAAGESEDADANLRQVLTSIPAEPDVARAVFPGWQRDLHAQNQLALSMIKNESVDQAVRRIASKGGVFDRERWRAERIVRTEGAWSYGVTSQRSMEEVAHEVPNLMKRLISTFDGREGEDAVEQHLQTVPVNGQFVWHKKTKHGIEIVHYSNVPSRPNDRAVVIPWREDYHAARSHPGAIAPSLPSYLR